MCEITGASWRATAAMHVEAAPPWQFAHDEHSATALAQFYPMASWGIALGVIP